MPLNNSTHHSEKVFHKTRLRWTFHFILGLVSLCSGMLRNAGGRKYIPVSPEAMPLRSCEKVYANVHARSQTETGALICCDGSNTAGWKNSISYEGFLCSQQKKPLPLVKSITRLPDLMILTFLPVLLRLIIHLYGWMVQMDDTHPDKTRTTAIRLLLYIFIIIFRVYGLYICLSKVQTYIHEFWNPRLTSEMLESADQQAMNTCWYGEFLMKRNVKNSCYGQQFDFSDHIVLFFAQSLPCMLIESTSFSTPQRKGKALSFYIDTVLSWSLSFFFVYLNSTTLLVAHSTAAYFHTPTEVAIGYMISLVVQIPIAALVCSMRWPVLRSYLGLPSVGEQSDLGLSTTAREHSD